MEAPDPQHGKDSQGKKNNSHSPDPLHQVSPEQDAVRHRIDILKDGSSGGGESAGTFKKRVNEFRASAAQIEWERTERGYRQPGNGDNGKSFTISKFIQSGGEQFPQYQAGRQAETKRPLKSRCLGHETLNRSMTEI